MKKITVYKLKPSVSQIDEALDAKYAGKSKIISLAGLPQNIEAHAVFRTVGGQRKTENSFPWLSFINTGLEDTQKLSFDATNKFPSAALVFIVKDDAQNESFYALAFGLAGNSFLNKDMIVRDFGIKVAMNICDPEELKRIRTKMHESISTQTERQTSAGSELTAFGINGEREFLQSIAGKTKKAGFEFIEAFHGKDSINLRFQKDDDLDWSKLAERVQKLGAASEKADYKSVFKSYDNFHSETDPEVVSSLDERLFAKIKAKEFEGIHLAPPDFFDYDRFDFIYGTEAETGRHNDLIIQDFIEQKSRSFSARSSVKSLKSQKISLYDSETETVHRNKYKLYDCLVAEAEADGNTYVLASGDWKKVSDSFLQEVNDYVIAIEVADAEYLENGISIWQPPNPEKEGDKGSDRESVYNETINANCNDVAMFDRSKITVAGEKKYEICDLLHSDKHFAHLKRYHSGAASISHLFAQGRFYGDAFMGDKDTRAGMRSYLEDLYADDEERKTTFQNLVPEKRADISTNDYTILFGILHNRDEMSVSNLPFMSRYELMYAHKHLVNLGYRCEVAFRRVVCGPPVDMPDNEEE